MDKLKRHGRHVPESEDHQTTTESRPCCYWHPKRQEQVAMIPNNDPLTLSNATYILLLLHCIHSQTALIFYIFVQMSK